MIRGFGVIATTKVLKGIWGPKGGVLRDQAVLEEISQRKIICKGGTRARAGGSQQVTTQPLQNWPRPINKAATDREGRISR